MLSPQTQATVTTAAEVTPLTINVPPSCHRLEPQRLGFKTI